MTTIVIPIKKSHENNFESMQTQNWDTSLAKLMRGVRFSPPTPTYLPVRCLTVSVLDQAGNAQAGR